MTLNSKKGFTLIELLVVVAIISLLSSIVFASLNTARSKGRDARRIADIKQIQNALELYRSDFGWYPTSLTGAIVTSLTFSGIYIASISDPSGGYGTCRPVYCYATNTPTTPSSYHLGAKMENLGSVTNSDSDFNSSGQYFNSGYWAGFDGADGGGANIYDIKY